MEGKKGTKKPLGIRYAIRVGIEQFSCIYIYHLIDSWTINAGSLLLSSYNSFSQANTEQLNKTVYYDISAGHQQHLLAKIEGKNIHSYKT